MTQASPVVARPKTAREAVLELQPTAFVNDDGQWVYIQIRRPVEERCPTCGFTHTVMRSIDARDTIASGNCDDNAWKNAATRLGIPGFTT